MKAVKQHTVGGPEHLYIGDTDKPAPKNSEVLVRVHASAMNRADLLQREGKYPPPPGASPIPGLELAGEVEAVGSGVKKWKKGDRVFGLVSGGAHAEYACVNEKMLLRMPESMSFEECAAIPEVFLTAYQSLVWHAALSEGEKVLIHAGGSGVGTAAIQLARRMGAKPIITASAAKHALCLALGAVTAVDYRRPDCWLTLSSIAGGVDVIVDPVGGPYFSENLKLLANDGRLVMLAVMGGTKTTDANIGQIVFKRLKVIGSTLRSRSLEYQAQLTHEFWSFAEKEFIAGRIKPVIDKVFELTEIRQAHEYMEANRNTGKVLLKIA